MSLDRHTLQTALSHVVDPTFGKSLGELGSLSDVRVEGDRVWATVRLSAASETLQSQLKEAATTALSAFGVRELQLNWDVVAPMRETSAEDPIPGVRNVLLVMSGKGGVGKSTCAANLALALRRAGARVGLLDADMYGPSVPTMFGIEGAPSSPDGVHIDPMERFGLKLMSVGFLLNDPKQALVWRGPILHSRMKQFLHDVSWGKLDYLVLDCPPGTGDVALSVAQQVKATGAIIVTTPQEVALADVFKSVTMCAQLQIPIFGVVENMSYFLDSAGVKHALFGEGGGAKIAEYAKANLLGQIPLEQSVREWGDKGTPIVQAAPSSSAAQEFVKIADTIATKIAADAFAKSGEKALATSGPTRLKIVK